MRALKLSLLFALYFCWRLGGGLGGPRSPQYPLNATVILVPPYFKQMRKTTKREIQSAFGYID